MKKYLVIVESPTKEKTITRMLGAGYTVKSSFGHIRDLPKSTLGIDVDNNFEPSYVNVAKARKIIPELKKLSAGAAAIYLATDYDREGEAIAWHLAEALKLPADKIRRITFHEITDEAIKSALSHPRAIDMDLVASQQARRVLDRLVGYKLSPLLWKKIKYGLSAGRVQSVAVKLICDREKEIAAFNPREYWTVTAALHPAVTPQAKFKAALAERAGVKLDKMDIPTRAEAEAILAALEKARYRVTSVESKDRRRSPPPPFTTSTLQQDASRRLGFSAARTMRVAQSLYEGIALGGGEAIGLITYMRTDSVNVAASARTEAAAYIKERFGAKHLPPKPRIYRTKSKGAQEAHEAVRPTSAIRAPESVRAHLTPDQDKLYDLIWRRFMACQMADAVFTSTAVDISAADCRFHATGSVPLFSGFLEVYQQASPEDDQTETLPALKAGQDLGLDELLPEQHFTEPPPRFNEASLIKSLEEHGIGRPSTYASIIDTIERRAYVRQEQRRFHPSPLGCLVSDILSTHFGDIVNVEFTAAIEEKLDRVAEGKTPWASVIKEFYAPFTADLEKAAVNIQRQKIEPQKTAEMCPKCGKVMVIRSGRRGQFIACSGFPECRTTFSLDRQGNKIVRPTPEPTDVVCEKCGRKMLKRFGARGPFLACPGFPKCRNIKRLPKDPTAEQDPAAGPGTTG